jgi:hypothetical protein
MSSLSKREVFLLFLMAVIVSTSLFVAFLINPLNAEIASNQDKLNTLEFQKQQTEINLSIIPTLRTRKGVRLAETESALGEIADPIHASEFERWILPVLSQYNARVNSVILSETTVATPELLYTQVTPAVYRLLELIQDYNQISVAAIQPLPTSTTQLLFAEYSYQISVSYDNFIEIVDAVKEWDTSYFISNAFYDLSEREGFITVRVYGVHKLTEQEILDIYKGDLGSHPNEITGPKGSSNPK